MRDDWVWTMHYADGATATEQEAGSVRAALRRGRVVKLDLHWAARPDLHPFSVLVPDGVQPIFFRRKTTFALNASGSEAPAAITVIGWKKALTCRGTHTETVDGDERSVACPETYAITSFLWLMPDGRVELTDHDDGRVR